MSPTTDQERVCWQVLAAIRLESASVDMTETTVDVYQFEKQRTFGESNYLNSVRTPGGA